MNPIASVNHRVQSQYAAALVAGTPPANKDEIQQHQGASPETKAAGVAPLTDTSHPQQTPLTNFNLTKANQSEKAAESTNTLDTTANRHIKPALNAHPVIQSTKPLFRLLQKVEQNVHEAYQRRENIKPSPSNKSSTGESASAKDLDEFRRARDELERKGQGGDLTKTDSYIKLKGRRSSSQFENLLPSDSKFRHLLDPFTGGIRDVQTGLYAELHVDTESGDLVLVFPGTGTGDMDTKQWLTNLAQFSGQGGVPAMYAQAAALAKEIQDLQSDLSFDNTSQGGLKLVGHSLGGGIANYVGLKHGMPATCYNAAALGRACLKDLGDIPKDRIAQQTHIHFKGDTVSSKKTQHRLAALLPVVWQVGIVIPRHIGAVYDLQPDPSTQGMGFWSRHRFSAFDDHYYPEAKMFARQYAMKYA